MMLKRPMSIPRKIFTSKLLGAACQYRIQMLLVTKIKTLHVVQ